MLGVVYMNFDPRKQHPLTLQPVVRYINQSINQSIFMKTEVGYCAIGWNIMWDK